MLRSFLLITVLAHALTVPLNSYAQSDLLKRIKAVQKISIWQRPQRSRTERQRLLKEVHSSDKQTMQEAFKQIALTRPNPAATDVIIEQTNAVARKTRDKFATSMAFEIKRDWSEAKKAAETLQIAQRNGGIRYLEQNIVRGNAAQTSPSLIASAYSGNRQAFRLVASFWNKSRIAGERAILIIGPAVAPVLARQLKTDDRSLQMEVAGILGKVGTEKQIQQIESLAEKADPNLRKRVNESIEEINERQSDQPAPKKAN